MAEQFGRVTRTGRRGYGWILAVGGGHLFFHANDVDGGHPAFNVLRKGQTVVFDAARTVFYDCAA